jgi:saccharopine dehydrogenase (NADP+, L-glutamate forming)
LAGKDGAKYLKDGSIKKLGYNDVFRHIETISFPNYGNFESYANRDSLHYIEKYNLENIKTLVRGTLRRPGFCSSWNILVQLGLTSFVEGDLLNIKEKYNHLVRKEKNLKVLNNLKYLDLFHPNNNFDFQFPGDFLQNKLEEKWSLSKKDKDMIVMQHQFEYKINQSKKRLVSSMVLLGTDDIRTAMAKTVGLPVFFAAKLILEGKVALKGVRIPVYEELYSPILNSLEKEGIYFSEQVENM